VLTIYASLAITFAYTLRFIILSFLREKSDYLKKTHLHEAPKIMLFSSGILAILCTVWGLVANLIAKFMHANVEIGLGEVFSPSTLIFLMVLLIGGFPVYLIYYRKFRFMEIARRNLLTPMNTVLEHAYFFDFFYDKVIARGIVRVSEGFGHIEKAIFEPLPYFVANGVMSLAHNAQKHLEFFADELLYMATNKTLASASKIRKMRSDSMQHYITAALIGFLIIVIITVITMLR
jgi:NADH:ubiquinone oxidoreductase subunit 5 (subunit L)/multisubunit Na+/H+ antiporter MnhA subunit